MASQSVQRVVSGAAALGLTIKVQEFPNGTKTAVDAANALGCVVDQIVKSMIFDADGELILALTSGTHQVDPKVLASLAGVGRCGRADPDQVRAITGYAIGGVPPFSHASPVRTWFDPHLLTFDEVWAAAGTPRHVFSIAPTTLIQVTAAQEGAFATSAG